MIPALLIVSFAVFMIIHLIPGDPAAIIAGPNATDEQLAALTHKFGLDEPLWKQYLIWLGNALTGNMGYSYINNYPVNDMIAQRVPATLELAFVAAIIAVVISFPLGIVAALKQGSAVDFASTVFAALSFAVPGFWLAILMILLFSLVLGWLPPSGRPKFSEQPVEHIKALIMPAMVLGLGISAKIARYLRSSMLDVLDQDYTRTARAKGLRERIVVGRHPRAAQCADPGSDGLGPADRRSAQRGDHRRIGLCLARRGAAHRAGHRLARLCPVAGRRALYRARFHDRQSADRFDVWLYRSADSI